MSTLSSPAPLTPLAPAEIAASAGASATAENVTPRSMAELVALAPEPSSFATALT